MGEPWSPIPLKYTPLPLQDPRWFENLVMQGRGQGRGSDVRPPLRESRARSRSCLPQCVGPSRSGGRRPVRPGPLASLLPKGGGDPFLYKKRQAGGTEGARLGRRNQIAGRADDRLAGGRRQCSHRQIASQGPAQSRGILSLTCVKKRRRATKDRWPGFVGEDDGANRLRQSCLVCGELR